MPHSLPVPADIKGRLAAFAATDDVLLALGIAEAEPYVSQDWSAADYKSGAIYAAAHFVTLWGAGVAGPAGAEIMGIQTAGGLVKAKVGDTEVSFADNGGQVSVGSGDGEWGTVWGRLYLSVRRRYPTTPMWV